jgi:hypothetical protein
MKLRKSKFEFNLFGYRVVIFISNFPHGYKKKIIKPDAVPVSFINIETQNVEAV